MQFSVTILGSNSALPTSGKYPTAQVLNASERFFLIDCGEGTQMQLRKNRIKFSRINHIFISHLHGDHCFGLIGLISTYSLLGRTSDLYIYGHSDLEAVFAPQIKYFCPNLKYNVIFIPVDVEKSEVIFEDSAVEVSTIPLLHRKPTCGFLFKEKERERHIIRDAVDYYKVPVKELPRIKKGGDYISWEGTFVKNSLLTKPSSPPRSYAFCSDTAFCESIVPLIEGVDMLYHEATFSLSDKKLARETFHSTASEAAEIALKANAKKLLIGHFSTRYKDTNLLLNEAKNIFSNVSKATEGDIFEVPLKFP
ncbi:ribonuclease Z [Marinilabiliaceae bacterium ANBcel2]|nr:ribonuclease Z [Marinilabiliaceae bacterium ANBcel2]